MFISMTVTHVIAGAPFMKLYITRTQTMFLSIPVFPLGTFRVLPEFGIAGTYFTR